MGGVTTAYVGDYYEQKYGLATKYYYLWGRRIAMRRLGMIVGTEWWLLTDHLGSTSVSYDTLFDYAVTQRYDAWGGVRYSSDTMPTDYAFTGQRKDVSDLLDYGARWYDPYLPRWTQPDTIALRSLCASGSGPRASFRQVVLPDAVELSAPRCIRLIAGQALPIECRRARAGWASRRALRRPRNCSRTGADTSTIGGSCRECYPGPQSSCRSPRTISTQSRPGSSTVRPSTRCCTWSRISQLASPTPPRVRPAPSST